MPDREKVIKDIDYWLKSRICLPELIPWQAIEKALALLKEQEHKDRMFHALEDDWKRMKELLKEQDERIKNLEHQLETITKWRANAGAFD